MTADFAVNNLRIEYFGLAGEVYGYDDNIKLKRKMCKRDGLILIEIYPKDLFKKDCRIYLRSLVSKIKKYKE
ncbi:hypothetical protein A2755_02330 [Candidatus Wolfebacteria bacterium RIFCSPHIGHO2_01_FULL_48_22]|uniref:DUF559 domain-containing protein n=2 Tax=Candidatus Wolfeibacteriota TaxID=1752735 RepID=A0A1F8DRF4_9BACT|nr:MAG: hypothetical protein A2755_02330 [Candidatus Wolfebacteria bacterium RIFCSPHIGHO2_01_FULL_48_22]OGM92284.1 MAG: hypothetical protein A2935_00740 [Candidatus Wolfebacteria bacterium RIFCSPLOWO2_01_FULL_47_17b]